MERCPQCRARYTGGIVCRRCEADFSFLLDIEDRADILSRQAMKCLAAGDLSSAAEKADAGRKLHSTPFLQALTGFFKIYSSDKK